MIGRPKKEICKNVRISTYVTCDVADMINERAATLGISTSQYVSKLIAVGLIVKIK